MLHLPTKILEGTEGGAIVFSLLLARPQEHGFISLRLKLKERLWILGTDHHFSVGESEKFSSIAFLLNMYILANICANYYHCLIALFYEERNQ